MRRLLTILLLRAISSILVVGPSTTPVEAALDRFERPQFCRDIMVTSDLGKCEGTHGCSYSQATGIHGKLGHPPACVRGEAVALPSNQMQSVCHIWV